MCMHMQTRGAKQQQWGGVWVGLWDQTGGELSRAVGRQRVGCGDMGMKIACLSPRHQVLELGFVKAVV